MDRSFTKPRLAIYSNLTKNLLQKNQWELTCIRGRRDCEVIPAEMLGIWDYEAKIIIEVIVEGKQIKSMGITEKHENSTSSKIKKIFSNRVATLLGEKKLKLLFTCWIEIIWHAYHTIWVFGVVWAALNNALLAGPENWFRRVIWFPWLSWLWPMPCCICAEESCLPWNCWCPSCGENCIWCCPCNCGGKKSLLLPRKKRETY